MTQEIQERAAIVRVAPEVLSELFQLPEGAYIDAVLSRVDEIGAIEFRIRGAGWPVALGQIIRQTHPTLRKTVDAAGATTRVDVEWKFPE